MTPIIYQRIEGAEYRHIYVVGDLHGCLSMLEDQLARVRFDAASDLLLSVGDLVDRGPDIMGCLKLIEEPWFACVRGNHEQMAIDALYETNIERWLRNGGEWFYALEGAEEQEARRLIKLADELPHVIEVSTESGNVGVAPAAYRSEREEFGKPMDGYEVIWNRDRINHALAGRFTEITGAKAFYFGHTPVEHPMVYANQHYIDTGAVFGGYLTLQQIQ